MLYVTFSSRIDIYICTCLIFTCKISQKISKDCILNVGSVYVARNLSIAVSMWKEYGVSLREEKTVICHSMLKHQPTSKAWKNILKLLNYEHKFKNCTSIPFQLDRWKTWIFTLVIFMFYSPCMVIMLTKIIVIIAIFPSLYIINMASGKIIFFLLLSTSVSFLKW